MANFKQGNQSENQALLKHVAKHGLQGYSAWDFLEISQNGALSDLSFIEQTHLKVLRVILLRQYYLTSQAETEFRQLEQHLDDLPIDSVFILSCEASRLFLHLNKETIAIEYLAKAEQLVDQVNPQLLGSLSSARGFLGAYLWDDITAEPYNFAAALPIPTDHPYSVAWSEHTRLAWLGWAAGLKGNYADGLVHSLASLSLYSPMEMYGGGKQQTEVNALLFRALLAESINTEVFSRMRQSLEKTQNTRLLSTVALAEGIRQSQTGKIKEAHQSFQWAIGNMYAHSDFSRATVFAFDIMLDFYREHNMVKPLIDLLEKRTFVFETLQVKANALFRILVVKASELNRAKEEIHNSYFELINRMAAIGENRDDSTGQHTQRVGEMAYKLAKKLNIIHAKELGEAARLHDLGKVALPDSILLKSSGLTSEEHQEMQKHTLIGAKLLADGSPAILKLAHDIARHHHERWDGTGYPDGLSGEGIPIAARIVAVADAYDALTSNRPYKKAWHSVKALQEIKASSGMHFDPQVVNALEKILSQPSKAEKAAKKVVK